jgi:hypothetical protein
MSNRFYGWEESSRYSHAVGELLQKISVILSVFLCYLLCECLYKLCMFYYTCLCMNCMWFSLHNCCICKEFY